MEVVIERGKRRVFARVVDWPGWCRAGRDEDEAVARLEEYRVRYQAAIGSAGRLPSGQFAVVERAEGNSTTDFGALATVVAADLEPLPARELSRLATVLQATWGRFDDAIAAVPAAALETKPSRGRAPSAIARHVIETELMHAAGIGGGPFRKPTDTPPAPQLAAVRRRILEALRAVPPGVSVQPQRRLGFDWTPRFVLHRSSWHALDHAWELEDRAG